MEECFILDFADAWVVQVSCVHEASGSNVHFFVLILCTVWTYWLSDFLMRFLSWGVLMSLLWTLLKPVVHQASKFTWGVRTVFNLFRAVVYCVLPGVGVQTTLHEEVKEITSRRVVSHMAVQIDSPKKGMRVRGSRVRERDKIHCNMSNHAFWV